MSSPFAGAHTSLSDFLLGANNFVVPEYQREYTWKSENVNQLLEDVEQGIRRLTKLESLTDRLEHGAKFLGCVIQWDRDATSGNDFVEAPGVSFISRVSELIDGQQRTSTAILLLCELYFALDSILNKLDQGVPEERALCEFCIKVQDTWLLPRFSRVGKTGANPRQRPSLIRQGTDKWTHSGPSHYKSALASYVNSVLMAIDAQPAPLARPVVVGKEIAEVVERLRELILDRTEDPFNYLQFNYDHQELFPALRDGRTPVDIEQYLHTHPVNEKEILSAISLISLAHYFLNYCAFTVITSTDQDIALDMFQSLNSTGVQLTAVQLLKPRISQSFRANGKFFNTDPIFATFERVNDWLNSGKNSGKKTLQFFLKFGLGIFGGAPGNSLSAQRSWLLQKYREFSSDGADIVKTREFIRLMSHVSDYLEHFYFTPRDKLFFGTPPPPLTGSRSKYEQFRLIDSSGNSLVLSDPVIVALMFVIDASHDLAHTFFSLYYCRFKEQPASGALKAKEELEKVILAVTACFVLWRTAFAEKYPDEAYRSVLTKINYLSFNGKSSQIGSALSVELRKKKKRTNVSKKWVDLLSAGFRYQSGNQTLIRFSLILAAHRKVAVDSGQTSFIEHGMIAADPAGPDYLHPDIWLGSEYKSIEHVAPQKLYEWSGVPVPHWSVGFTSTSDAMHSIGNLTLLSVALNASTPEDTPSKCNHYGALIAPGAAPGVTPTAATLMASSPALSHLVPVYVRLVHWLDGLAHSSVVASANAWDEQFIKRRAHNIALVISEDLLRWLRAR
jgi:hypothetical protein